MPLSERGQDFARDTYNKNLSAFVQEREEAIAAVRRIALPFGMSEPAADAQILRCHLAFLRKCALARVSSKVAAYKAEGKVPSSTDFELVLSEVAGWLSVQGTHLAREPEFSTMHESIARSSDGINIEARREFRLAVNETVLRNERERVYTAVGLHDVLETALLRIFHTLENKDAELPRQIEAAAARLRDRNPESWSQAAVTCRRMLKVFADAVYPPASKSPSGRELDDSHFLNRIWQYIEDRVSNKQSRELAQSALESLGRRVDAIYEISSKGVHADFSMTEASLSLVQTVFLLAEISELVGDN